MVLRKTVLLGLFIAVLPFCSKAERVCVYSQAQFDEVVERINSGEEMEVRLAKNTFVLNKRIKATAPLSIIGRHTIITCYDECFDSKYANREEGEYYLFELSAGITPYSLFFDKTGNIVEVSETVDEVLGVNLTDVIVADKIYKAGTAVRIPVPENLRHLKNHHFEKAFGYFDCGWQVVNFLLEKADEKYLYCKTLNNCRTGNYYFDKSVYKKPIRFVLYNVEKTSGTVFYDERHLYVPKNIGTVYVLNGAYYNSNPNIIANSDFSMEGLRFVGMRGVEVNSKASTRCEIRNCEFKNSLGCALKIIRHNDRSIREAKVDNCVFKDCSLFSGDMMSLESPYQGGNYISVKNCILARYSENNVNYKNPEGGIWVRGNVTLTGNEVYNTPRCHLYFNQGVIVARGNVLYNTDEFNAQTYRNISSDWGLVYCNHIFTDTQEALENKEHQILLENNLLYGAYTYGNFARGIYIDDGRGDVECRNNIILNTESYSMDSRNVSASSSVRNRYVGNIVSSIYQLIAGKSVNEDNMPITSGNILLDSRDNQTAGIKIVENDSRLELDTKCFCKEGKVFVSKDLYKRLKKSAAWRGVKRHVSKK